MGHQQLLVVVPVPCCCSQHCAALLLQSAWTQQWAGRPGPQSETGSRPLHTSQQFAGVRVVHGGGGGLAKWA
jgi:hypothetical protein